MTWCHDRLLVRSTWPLADSLLRRISSDKPSDIRLCYAESLNRVSTIMLISAMGDIICMEMTLALRNTSRNTVVWRLLLMMLCLITLHLYVTWCLSLIAWRIGKPSFVTLDGFWSHCNGTNTMVRRPNAYSPSSHSRYRGPTYKLIHSHMHSHKHTKSISYAHSP